MSRYIDADALMKEFCDFVRPSNNSDFAQVPNWNDAVSLVGSAPTADVVKVVRCHECRYNDGGYCSMLRERTKRNGVEVRIWSQFFCAYGEKEEK